MQLVKSSDVFFGCYEFKSKMGLFVMGRKVM